MCCEAMVLQRRKKVPMRQLMDAFFRHYLTERNLEDTLALTTDTVISVGTGVHEIAHNQKELRQLLEREFEEVPDPLPYEIIEYKQSPVTDDVCTVLTKLCVKLQSGGMAFEMTPRLTCTCVRKDGVWKIACLHMSAPAQDQEADRFFPLRYGSHVANPISVNSGTKLMNLISEVLPGGIMGGFLEDGFPLYTINDRMLDILGYTYDELLAVTDEKMLNIIYEPDRKMVEESITRQFMEKNEYEVEYRAVGKDDRIIWVKDIGRKIITEGDRPAMISIITDITEQVERESQLVQDAEYDSLTNLYNRRKAMALIKAECSENDGGTLFICDVDNFKSINDTRGHMVGDRVLVQLADIMKAHIGKDAVAARLGGDEYILFFPSSVCPETAAKTVAAIQKAFMDYAKTLTPELNISLSAGGTVRNTQEDLWAMYRKADVALYQSKKYKGELFWN